MEYFMIEVDENFTPPRLENWFGKLDANGAKSISQYEMFMLSNIPGMVFTDIIMYPCFMVSQEAKQVIEMYEPTLLFQRVVLFNNKKKTSRSYFVPYLRQSHPSVMEKQNAPALVKSLIEDKVRIFMGLELVESMLRRNMIGIGLKEVKWVNSEENQDGK